MVEQIIDTISEIEELDSFENEYVYDICVNDREPYFFANDILVHNSSYFSAWPFIKDAVESGEMEWNKETAIATYNGVADEVNVSFPPFMKESFHAPTSYGEIIRCGREVVGLTGLFIVKKHYAILVLDNEGKACDVDGKPGKLKAMGLDLKRSDTSPMVQKFLKELLMMVLTNQGKENVIQKIKDFKNYVKTIPPWEKGRPMAVNALTKYVKLEKESLEEYNKSARLPGHVRAGYNFNRLCEINNDMETMRIQDGTKAIVCKLKENLYGITSIARPTDEKNIPDWFKELPFDDATMEEKIIDQKVENLLGVLEWNLREETDISTTFFDLFG